MGAAGTDVAVETVKIVLMAYDVSKVAYAIDLRWVLNKLSIGSSWNGTTWTYGQLGAEWGIRATRTWQSVIGCETWWMGNGDEAGALFL